MKNSADLGGCYPPQPSASVDNTLLELQNSSYPTQPHSIIANYTINGALLFKLIIQETAVKKLQDNSHNLLITSRIPKLKTISRITSIWASVFNNRSKRTFLVPENCTQEK